MRAFIAIEVPSPRAEPGPVTGRAPTHLTLRFLGDLPTDRVDAVHRAMDSAAGKVAPFNARLGGVGAFPSAHNPRVVWRGVVDGADDVMRLAAAVSDALATEGIPPDPRPFAPHVTLFRVHSAGDRERARAALESGKEWRSEPFRVDTIHFKESELAAGGAVHRPLYQSALSGPAR